MKTFNPSKFLSPGLRAFIQDVQAELGGTTSARAITGHAMFGRWWERLLHPANSDILQKVAKGGLNAKIDQFFKVNDDDDSSQVSVAQLDLWPDALRDLMRRIDREHRRLAGMGGSSLRTSLGITRFPDWRNRRDYRHFPGWRRGRKIQKARMGAIDCRLAQRVPGWNVFLLAPPTRAGRQSALRHRLGSRGERWWPTRANEPAITPGAVDC